MAVQYSPTSPYYNTPLKNNKLGKFEVRSFAFEQDDLSYQIDAVYHNRPDLLSNDIYGKSGLWWVFQMRNPDVLIDPIYDFSTGTTIYLPKIETLVRDLGV
jgi:alpha-L-fucosidase